MNITETVNTLIALILSFFARSSLNWRRRDKQELKLKSNESNEERKRLKKTDKIVREIYIR